MNNNIGTQLMYTTVAMTVNKKSGEEITGTSFFYTLPKDENTILPLLITNKHILENADVITFYLHVSDEQGNPIKGEKKEIIIKVDNNTDLHLDSDNDLAALEIGKYLNSLNQGGIKIFFRSVGPEIEISEEQKNKLGAIEDLIVIGYPDGIIDLKNNFPIVRKGISATPIWNKFEGENIFLIDAGIYPGSSGSPVYIYNQGSYASDNGITIGTRLYFLGVISETCFSRNNNQVYLGLGVVINNIAVKKFIDKIKRSMD